MTVRVKRIYEPVAKNDGVRILIDRIWPRGISRFKAKIARWDKEIAPTTTLRQWFGHRPERRKEFQRRYQAEQSQNPGLADLHKMSRSHTVTLFYPARDTRHNHALVLAAMLGRKRAPQLRISRQSKISALHSLSNAAKP